MFAVLFLSYGCVCKVLSIFQLMFYDQRRVHEQQLPRSLSSHESNSIVADQKERKQEFLNKVKPDVLHSPRT